MSNLPDRIEVDREVVETALAVLDSYVKRFDVFQPEAGTFEHRQVVSSVSMDYYRRTKDKLQAEILSGIRKAASHE